MYTVSTATDVISSSDEDTILFDETGTRVCFSDEGIRKRIEFLCRQKAIYTNQQTASSVYKNLHKTREVYSLDNHEVDLKTIYGGIFSSEVNLNSILLGILDW